MSINIQQKLFDEEKKVVDSKIVDINGDPIQQFIINNFTLSKPFARISLIDTFEQIIPEIRIFKYSDDVATIYVDGKPKAKGCKPYRFYAHLEAKQVLHAARSFARLYKFMTGYPESFVIGLLQSPDLIERSPKEFTDYTRRKIESKPSDMTKIGTVVSSGLHITLDLNASIKQCECGFSEIIKADKCCPACNRKIVWESK